MPAPVPSLSSAGWVQGPAEKADLLFSYYFTSEYSQSLLYQGSVISLPAQVQQMGHDPLELRLLIRKDIERLFQPYFEQVSVEVTTDTPDPADPTRLNITLDCSVVDAGVTYSLGRLISTVNSKILKIKEINNGD